MTSTVGVQPHVEPGDTALEPRAAAVHHARSPAPGGLEALALAVFGIVVAVMLVRHSMWSDEVEAWNVSRASRSVGDLLVNLRYEGHPYLWYVPVYALTRLTGDPRWMQVLHWCIAVGVAAVVLFRAPFPRWARLMTCFGYVFVFEYAVVTRSYGMAMLFFLLAITEVRRPEPRWALFTALIVLLAFSNAIGGVLAFSVSVAVVSRRGTWRAARTTQRVAVVAGVAAAGLSALSSLPPPDFESFAAGLSAGSRYGNGRVVEFVSALSATWRGLVPIPQLGFLRWPGTSLAWNSQLLDHGAAGILMQAVLSILLVVVVWRCLRGAVVAAALWLVGVVAFTALFLVAVLPEQAHYSSGLFALFVGACWIAWPSASDSSARATSRNSPKDPILLSRVFACVLAVQCVAAVLVAVPLTFGEFSPDRALAGAAAQAGVAADLVSADDYHATAASGYLDEGVYSLPRSRPIRFVRQDHQNYIGHLRLGPSEALCGARKIADRRGRSIGLVAPGSWDLSDAGRVLFHDPVVQLVLVDAAGSHPACTP